jgi:hypothetical protein
MNRICACGQPITKGYYKKCFKCNTSKESHPSDLSPLADDDEPENVDKVDRPLGLSPFADDIPLYKKQTIPKTVKNCLWINFFENSRIGVCQVCKREEISFNNFQACHIVAERNGGTCALDNLIPGCALCNASMGCVNLNEFIKTYNLHFGLRPNDKSPF